VNGVRVIKAFQLEDKLLGHFNNVVDDFIHHSIQTISTSAKRLPIPQIIIACSYLWVIGFGAYLIGQNQLQVGQFVAAVLDGKFTGFSYRKYWTGLTYFCGCTFISASRIWQCWIRNLQFEIKQILSMQYDNELNIRLDNVSFQDKQHRSIF
jgi:ATP-binding cassette subfamily B protein